VESVDKVIQIYTTVIVFYVMLVLNSIFGFYFLEIILKLLI